MSQSRVKHELDYALLSPRSVVDVEDEDGLHDTIHRPKQSARPSFWLVVIIISFVEIAHVLLYACWHFVFTPFISLPGPMDLPSAYNISQTFTANVSDLSLVHSSPDTDSYWSSITKGANNGLVSLPTRFAYSHNLELSGLNTTAGESVFQVDAFHQLHCLARIREMIISYPSLLKLNPNLGEKDRYYQHTLHCVDYLRQTIMCNADLTLVSTGQDLEFDHSPPRQCRDWDAVVGWVEAWKWIPNEIAGNKY
ncbi:hypothetical protein EV356DRAFT_78282 [Viridothelium virens]|uniref:Uncharacterized protein n=1 Tax=Viridothelium virens TaxID=1048519 RepID=A0A6A6HFN0_VIRVR|nr:hypothetical protein EV356DRAFT_78282 [Viridothelium virens]